ncbi:efflux RND transporter periplasmic adaptor subunit [Methyloraptor flagellatus]|uniref:efflux RND transporter periplasmic adaptor subunit n=1 Tax=Methyloraptor flagellatus TaxID=3162530 RepID=UPI00387DD24E
MPDPAHGIPRGSAFTNKGSTLRTTVSFVWAHRWFALVVVVLLALGAWQVARVAFGPEIVVDRVKRADLVRTVVASGHVETPFRVEIAAQITGTVSEVLVEDGQRVARGQPLVKLEPQELQAAVVQAQGALAQARARIRQLTDLTLPMARENLAQAQATLRNAQAAFDRTAELARNGHSTLAALDDAQRALDIARTQVNTAQLQVFTASPEGSDYVLAQTQLDQAEANLATARSRLGYATVAAPRDGVLIARKVEQGTVVQPGRAMLVLAPAGTTQLVLQIDERNLGLIAVGQPALASADAYPDARFNAVVSYINPGVDIARASVEVKLNVAEPPAYLRQDMTVSVDIEVGRRNATLVLPLRSIRDAGSAQPWVLAARDGRAHRQPVRLGLRGNVQAEILDGIGEGDLVVPTTSSLRPGQRLRPVLP